MSAFQDLTGRKFGRLTVIEQGETLGGRVAWSCCCECGSRTVVRATDLRSGKSKSCGCVTAHNFQDITGQRFGRLLVIKRSENVKSRATWICRCDCGSETIVPTNSLNRGNTKSCGCLSPKFQDLTGQRFERLVVIKRGDPTPCGVLRWVCKCDCGEIRQVQPIALKSGNTKSCGCYKHELRVAAMTTHGKSISPEYKAWEAMNQRANNLNFPRHKDWGGRGIGICARWKVFQNFLDDMGLKPTPEHSLDRIDNNKGYEPGNCRWATRSQQQRNTRRNRLLTYRGETKCLTVWSGILGLSTHVIRHRILKAKWTVEKAFETPAGGTK